MRSRIWHRRLRVAEAAVLLGIARLLIRGVRFGRWRSWIGQVDAAVQRPPIAIADMDRVRAVTRAVDRAARGRANDCLPKAIATQWMLRRRSVFSRLVIGVAPRCPSTPTRALHAWVQVGPQIVMGADRSHACRQAFSLSRASATR